MRGGIGKGRDDGPRTDGRSGGENETARGAMILERDVDPEAEAVEGDLAEVEDVHERGDRKGSRRWAADRWEKRGRKRNGARSDDFGTGCRPRSGSGRRRPRGGRGRS